MRTVLITLLLVFAANTANATDAPTLQDRTIVADALDRSCHAVYYAQAMKEAAASGQAVALTLQDPKSIPVDEVRARMKGAPETARFDRQIVAGCNCIVERWKKRIQASSTWPELKAINIDMVKRGVTPETLAHDKACVAKASADMR